MHGGKSILAVITARGGSKGLPRKNVLDAAGKPLIAWSIEAARGSIHVDRTIVSTDDAEIIDIALNWHAEVPFIRPAELASDSSSIYDVLIHALDALERSYDLVVLLQATSPLRTARDIDACIEVCCTRRAPACITICPATKSPYHHVTMAEDGRLRPILPLDRPLTNRQELPSSYVINGAVYVARVDWLRRTRTFFSDDTVGHTMPPERSIDVDSELDLTLARALLSKPQAETL